MTTLVPTPSVLPDALLERCAQRAATYDRENRFFFEDFEDLRQAGYLLIVVPQEFGGLGLSLAEVCQEQRRLARRSAPTALALNMHILATGIAADLYRQGDRSQQWLLEEAAQGEVIGYGHAEAGNDLEVLYAAGKAERVEGGYRFTGRKNFGSLTPAWTRLCIYGVDMAHPDGPPSSTASCHVTPQGITSRRRGTRSGCAPPAATMRSWRARLSQINTSCASDRRALRALMPSF
jgi:alkylation response protein AidB-like acyl-CoA dehydrogenase